MIETQKPEYLCPECAKPFDPSHGVGVYGKGGTKDGIPYSVATGIQLTCGQHSWQLPGKTMMDVISACPVLAPEFIRMSLSDQALRSMGV